MNRNDPLHPYNQFGEVHFLSSKFEKLDEYIFTCLVLAAQTFLFYIVVSTLTYILFYVLKPEVFTPRRLQKVPYLEQKLYDIKWSFYNIVGQTPILIGITFAYPHFSQVQYEWQFSPLLFVWIFLHFALDQFFTYWAHRALHHPRVYSWFHIVHHKSTSITPYSALALHPIDGILESLPMFLTGFFLPIPFQLISLHITFSLIWLISVHDNINFFPFKFILFASHHSIHHYPWGRNYNFGKMTSVCDRIFGSYCDPDEIAGYGYKNPLQCQNLFNQLNHFYETFVPWNNKQRILSEVKNVLKKSN